MDESFEFMSSPLYPGVITLSIAAYFMYSSLTGPLAHLPGPMYTKFTGLVKFIAIMRGNRHLYLKSLHERYGPTVRVAPREVSITDNVSVKEIFRIGGDFLKPSTYEALSAEPGPTVFSTSDPAYHSRWRKLLGGAMSESSLKNLQFVVQSKVDLLMAKLKEERSTKGYMDVFRWNHFFTTDVIAELSFGQSFETLEKGEDTQYVRDLTRLIPYNFLRAMATGRTAKETQHWPIWPFTAVGELNSRTAEHTKNALAGYRKYLEESDSPRPNFFDKVLCGKGREAAITETELVAHAMLYMVAGTDTTAVALSYLIWTLFENPKARLRLMREIELAGIPERPTNDQLRAIPYLEHVIDETLRMYPVTVGPLSRVVPQGGRNLGDHFIPENLIASPFTWLTQRDPSIFHDPETWNPDRWEVATKEMKDSLWAFGGGSRVCMGLHLAKLELRLALVAFLRTFETTEIAYGVDGFKPDDMEIIDRFIAEPKAGKLLMK